EFRGKDPSFARMRDDYLDRLALAPTARVLELGCGTGVILPRSLPKRPGFLGRVVGVDQSAAFIEAARRFAAEEGVADRVEFHVGDIHALPFPDASFDAVVAHTTISHVSEPLIVLKEAARVLHPDGTLVIFDGDYASWTFAYPEDPALGQAMEAGIIASIANN